MKNYLDEITFDKAMFRHRLLSWYDKHKVAHPWRLDWQKSKSAYPVWLSEIMLQQTVIKAVLPVYARFLHALPTVEHLAQAEEAEVRQLVRGLGYYRRFAFMHRAAKQLYDARKNGNIQWPKSFDEWKKLPGIGNYTAAAISSIAYSWPAAVVDGNIERILCRLLNISEAVNAPHLKKHYQRWADQLVDHKRPGDFNQAFMELGQRICTPTKPNCELCPINIYCEAYEKGTQATAPLGKIKKEVIPTHLRIFIPVNKDGVAIMLRSDKAKFLKGTAGFVTAIEKDKKWQSDGVDFNISELEEASTALGVISHNITNHRIKAEVFKVPMQLVKQKKLPETNVFEHHDIEKHLISNLDRKAWRIFERSAKA